MADSPLPASPTPPTADRGAQDDPPSPHPNADRDELSKFDRLAERWWDPHGEFKPLHAINPLRLGYIAARVPGGLTGKRVLDVGCGGGILAESLAGAGATVTAIDLAPAPLAVARAHARHSGAEVTYREVSAEDLARGSPDQFDVVTCLEMLEHVPDPSSTIAACATLVRPGGQVFFSTINRNARAYLLAIIGAEYVLRLLPRGTHDYAKLIRPSELDAMARASGLALRDMTGMHYNPLTEHYRLGPGVEVNYLAAYDHPAPAPARAAHPEGRAGATAKADRRLRDGAPQTNARSTIARTAR